MSEKIKKRNITVSFLGILFQITNKIRYKISFYQKIRPINKRDISIHPKNKSLSSK